MPGNFVFSGSFKIFSSVCFTGKGCVMPAKVDTNRCTGCESCLESCPSEAIKMDASKAKIDRDACVDCAVCVGECPVEAISME